MDPESIEALPVKNDISMKNKETESVRPEFKANQEEKHLMSTEDIVQLDKVHYGGSKNVVSGASTEDMNLGAEMNMEASITSDDVMRAGGFGARDDIGCFLPVASDSTDFEASLREARVKTHTKILANLVLDGKELETESKFLADCNCLLGFPGVILWYLILI